MIDYHFVVRERLAVYREWIDGRPPRRFTLVLFACFVVAIAVTISTAYMSWLRGFEEGEPATGTVVAQRSVTVLDGAATEKLKAHVAELVTPVYVADPEATQQAVSALESFIRSVDGLREEVRRDLSEDEALTRLKALAPETVSHVTLSLLLTGDDAVYGFVARQASGSLRPVFAQPITEDNLASARQRLHAIVDSLGMPADVSTAVFEVASGFIRPNHTIDEGQTLARRQAAAAQVAPVMITVPKGAEVVRDGEIVSAEDLLVLNALGVTETRSGWPVWLGIFLLVLLEGVVFFVLLRRLNRPRGLPNTTLLAVVMLMIGFTVIARLLILEPLSPYVIPVAGLAMVTAIILNSRTALLAVALMSVNVGLLTDLQMRYVVVALITGALAAYLVSKVVQRASLLGAGGLVMVAAAFTTFAMEVFRETGVGAALELAVWGLAHGLLAWVLTVLLLLILDLGFNLSTPLRLLELANPAQPLLKKLLQVAPGTYNHSILMGNLAEAAAEAIGADSLLARVGAYYHDIGKTVRPEYFVENQIYVDNPHDRLSPNLSKLAIAAHVRDGEHLAKVHGLPSPMIDIIRQHHGTSVMAFFFHKAQGVSRAPVDEESYRYEEEKPHSKEAAIIMLADGTEAAVRAMHNPTRRRLRVVIEEVFRQKIEDGQLDESELTLGDIHKIKESFEVSLRGLVGHRVPYPERTDQHENKKARPYGHGANGAGTGPAVEGEPGSGRSRPRIPPSAATLHTRGRCPESNSHPHGGPDRGERPGLGERPGRGDSTGSGG